MATDKTLRAASRRLRRLTLSVTALAMLGCATDSDLQGTAWTDEQQAAYDECLRDNMAVAMAWEMIEQSCREQVAGPGSDPLEMR